MSIARCLLSSWSLFNLTCSKEWAKWSHVMFLDCQDWQAYHKFCTINLAKSIAREAWNCAHPRYSWHSRSGTKSSKFEQFARWDHAPLCIAFLSSNACSSWRHTPRWTRWKEIGLTHRGSRIAAQKKGSLCKRGARHLAPGQTNRRTRNKSFLFNTSCWNGSGLSQGHQLWSPDTWN